MCISVTLITVTTVIVPLVVVVVVGWWVNNDVAVNIVSGLDKLPVNRQNRVGFALRRKVVFL
jgi:hypothetical protein